VRIHTGLSVVDFAPITTVVNDGQVIAEFTLADRSPDQHQLDGVEVELLEYTPDRGELHQTVGELSPNV